MPEKDELLKEQVDGLKRGIENVLWQFTHATKMTVRDLTVTSLIVEHHGDGQVFSTDVVYIVDTEIEELEDE